MGFLFSGRHCIGQLGRTAFNHTSVSAIVWDMLRKYHQTETKIAEKRNHCVTDTKFRGNHADAVHPPSAPLPSPRTRVMFLHRSSVYGACKAYG